jgi:hypothetical protein
MASNWEKLKKMFSYNPMIKKERDRKKKLASIARETEGDRRPIIGAKKDKVGKETGIYQKAMVKPTAGAKGSVEELKKKSPGSLRTTYEPAKEETKGGTYFKYGKDTKQAGSFREAFAGARKSWKAGKGGDTFEWRGKKYSVQTADDKKRKKKFAQVLPGLKNMG